jgi:hypothetical protein
MEDEVLAAFRRVRDLIRRDVEAWLLAHEGETKPEA